MSWREQARCRDADPDIFFPSEGATHMVDAARAVCNACPVREECLEYALTRPEVYGVWGGLTPVERRELRQRLGYRMVKDEGRLVA